MGRFSMGNWGSASGLLADAPPNQAAAESRETEERRTLTADVGDWIARRRGELATLTVFTFILVAHAPQILFEGRFWAEEGGVFFRYAWTHPFLDALTVQHMGYYSFVPNLAAVIGARIPLEWAPSFTVALGLLVQLLPPVVLLFSSIPGLTTPIRKGVALLLLLVVPSNPEVLLITLCCPFTLCTMTGLILIADHGGGVDRIGKWALLILAGLTGVVSTFLTPFFWFQWWKERRRERLVQAAILTGCAALQLMLMSRAMTGGQRNMHFDAAIMAGVAYAKFIVTPLSPTILAFPHLKQLQLDLANTGVLPFQVWLLTVIILGGLLAACWMWGTRSALLLAAASLWVGVLSLAGGLGANDKTKLLPHMIWGQRYYYAPQFFFFLALLMCLAPGARLPRWLQGLTGLWLGAVVLMGLYNFARAPLDFAPMFSGPSWEESVQEWRQDPSKPLPAWPHDKWHFTLPPRRK